MRDFLQTAVLACVLACLTPACGGEQSPPTQPPPSQPPSSQPPSSQPPPGSITGRELLGWDQPAPHADELREYFYALYVDGVAVALTNATCGALTGEGPSAACSSPLPPLQPGQRVLELATRVTWDGVVRESARSAPLVVTVAGTAFTSAASLTSVPAAPRPSGSRPAEMLGPDATPYLIEMVASGLDRPSALARLPDGRLLIAERGGRIRVAQDGLLLATPAAVVSSGAGPGDDDGLGLAVAPDFWASRHVYMSYIAHDDGGSPVGRVARYREVGGTLGEPAVVIDGLPAGERAQRIRFGPDGALYVGTTAVETRDADDLGSYAGKILRFTADGGTPSDSRTRFSPVYSSGHRGRLDFDWEPATQALWSVDTGPRGVLLRRTAPGGPGERSAFLEGIHAAASAFHTGATPAAWRNSLFLASPDDECLYRVTGFGSAPSEPVVERLLAGSFGRITAVISADDGLYFATQNGSADDRGQPSDAVFRIRGRGVLLIAPARREQ